MGLNSACPPRSIHTLVTARDHINHLQAYGYSDNMQRVVLLQWYTWGDVNTHHLPLMSGQGLEGHPSWMSPDLSRVIIGGGYDVASRCAWREGGEGGEGGREAGRKGGREGGREGERERKRNGREEEREKSGGERRRQMRMDNEGRWRGGVK